MKSDPNTGCTGSGDMADSLIGGLVADGTPACMVGLDDARPPRVVAPRTSHRDFRRERHVLCRRERPLLTSDTGETGLLPVRSPKRGSHLR